MTTADATRHRRWYGREDPPLPAQTITLGPLSLLVDGVDVRRVTYDGAPIMDRIFVAIRDPDWGTLPAIFDAPVQARTDDPTTGQTILTVGARHADATMRFAWQGRVTIGPGARVSVEMDGVAEATFRYARMGLCALLPARSMAGRPYRADGASGPHAGTLPRLISPQLIVDGLEEPLIPAIDELTVELPEVSVRMEFEGDDFELEDQRNWTDDSFKAYSLMSGEPRPRTAQTGQRFRQRVTVTVVPRLDGPQAGPPLTPHQVTPGASPDEVVLTVTDAELRWPAIGLGDSTDGRGLGSAETRALSALHLDHTRLDVHPGSPGWQEGVRRGVADARSIGAELELALSLDEAASEHLALLPGLLEGVPVARILVLHAPTQARASTPAGWVARARTVLGDAFPDTRWVGGTDGDFAEINRDRPVPGGIDALDGVCFGLNPQIHASDEMSMAETLPAQGLTVATVAAWFPAADVCITPVTLRQRFNPAAAAPDVAAATGPLDDVPVGLPAGVDARQRSLFGAGWTLGSIAALTDAGATSVTWHQTAGWRGLLEWSQPPARPGWGPVTAGEIYPMYHVFGDLGDRSAMVPLRCSVTEDRDIVALAMRSSAGIRVLLANLTARPIRVRIEGLPDGIAESRTLDETTPVGSSGAEPDRRVPQRSEVDGGTSTLELRPFGYVRLDVMA